MERTFNYPSDGVDSSVRPEPQGDATDDSASFFDAPKLFNPKDQTANGGSPAPVRTAVYQKPAAGAPTNIRTISVSRRQAELDARGWSSVSN